MDHAELGTYLRHRRGQRTPEAAGLHLVTRPRRVPGLRREELALLANVSPSYYTRLEQGQHHHPSPQVLDAIATVLGLVPDERAHLFDLAHAATRATMPPPTESVSPSMRELLPALHEVPALLTGRRGDVLAWNTLGHSLLFAHLPVALPDAGRAPNLARHHFLDEHARSVFPDWTAKAHDLVAHLRLITGRHPDDHELFELVGELSVRSPEFAQLWAEHSVAACSTTTYRLRHPEIGELEIQQQTLVPTDAPDQLLALL